MWLDKENDCHIKHNIASGYMGFLLGISAFWMLIFFWSLFSNPVKIHEEYVQTRQMEEKAAKYEKQLQTSLQWIHENSVPFDAEKHEL